MPLGAAAFVVIAVACTAVSSYLAFSPERSGRFAFWALALGPTVVLAGVSAIWASREDLLREWLSPGWGHFTQGVLGAIALFALAWAVTRLVAPTGSTREIWLVTLYGQIGDPRTLQARPLAVGAAIGAAALAEEILWRGLVTQIVADRIGSRTAWIAATGLYTLAYVPTAWALRDTAGLNPLLVVAAAGGGLFWAGVARYSGSLVPAFLAHALFDWIVVMMFPLWGASLLR